MRTGSGIAVRLGLCLLLAGPGGAMSAQEVPAQGAPDPIALELNGTDPIEAACALTFMVRNGLSEDIDKLVYETVLIDRDGRVDRLTLFDFGALPADRTRVRQFAVPDFACESLGRLLINGAETCTIAGAPSDLCEGALSLSSRIDVEVIR